MAHKKYVRLEIQGMCFKTSVDAAAFFKVTELTVQRAIRNGTQHRIGSGRTGIEPFPVRIRGKVYPNARAAAKALKVTTGAIYQALLDGDIDRVGRPLSMRKPSRTKPFEMGSVKFPSLAEAERALGLPKSYISHSKRNGRNCAMERILAATMAYEAKQYKLAA